MEPLCVLQTTCTDGISKNLYTAPPIARRKLGHSKKGSYTSDQVPNDNEHSKPWYQVIMGVTTL